MKRWVKVTLFSILIISIMLTGVVLASDLYEKLINKYSHVQDEEELIEKLSLMSFEEIIAEINVLSEKTDASNLITHANVLKDKAADISVAQLESEIVNEKNTDITRVILIQINSALNNVTNDKLLKSLVEQDNINFEIKRNALLSIFKSKSNNTTFIEKIALGNDERLAFQAIKQLSRTHPEKAIRIADDILDDYNGTMTDKVRAALKAKAIYLSYNSAPNERIEFIDFCEKILIANNYDSEAYGVFTVLNSLSDTLSEETITYIVNNENIYREFKLFSIERNFTILRSMITDENYTEDNLNTVIKAMKIMPIKQLSEPLEKVMKSKELSETVVKEIEAVIYLIETDGFTGVSE